MLNRVREWWDGLEKQTRIVLAASALGAVVALVGFVSWAGTPEYVPLFANLKPDDASAITEQLKTSGVPYKLLAGGTAVEVPAQKRDELRLKFAAQRLPADTSATMDPLSHITISTGQAMENEYLLQSRENEIAKSIMSLAQVAHAGVNLAAPRETPFVPADGEQRPTAAVLVSVKPGHTLSDENVRAILRLTQMSYTGLTEKDVTIMGAGGEVFWDPQRAGTGFGDERLKQQTALEASKRRELQGLMNQILPGKVHILVNAELDYGQKQTERVMALPGVVTQSSTTEETLKGEGVVRGQGAPGLGANTPAAPPPGGAAVPTYGAKTSGAEGEYKNKTATKTMLPGQEKTVESSAPGRIEKLTVSAIVDSAVPADQVASIKTALEAAIAVPTDGANASDTRLVAVTQLPFDRTADDAAKKDADAAARAENTTRMVSVAVPLVLMLICFFLLSRALKKPMLAQPGGQLALAGAGGGFPALSGGMGAALAFDENGDPLPGQTVDSLLGGDAGVLALPGAFAGEPRTFEMIESTFDSTLESITHMAKSKPETVALLVKGWMSEES